MTSNGRPAVCLMVPGHDLVENSGLARYLCGLANALAELARVTLVFRRILTPLPFSNIAVAALNPGAPGGEPGYWDFASVPRDLARFSHDQLGAQDLVLEATWLQTGKISAASAERGIPGIPLIDRLPVGGWLDPVVAPGTWLAQRASGRYLRHAGVIVAASDRLKDEVVERCRVSADRVEVVPRGVDRTMFAPRDQAVARKRLGIPEDETMLVYAGSFGPRRDLTPLLDAVVRVGDPDLRLHVIGEGGARPRFRGTASKGHPVVYHPRVPYEAIVDYIAASDLCIHLQDPGGAADGVDWDGTIGVAEYLAAGRPVAIGGAEPEEGLVRHLFSGFYVEHDTLAWIRFLQRDCPSRKRLQAMGKAASATPSPTLAETAARYLALGMRMRGRD